MSMFTFFRKSDNKRSLKIGPESSFMPIAINGDSSVNVNNDTAMRFTAIYAAIRIRSENIASLPKAVYKKTEAGREPDESHPAYDLIHTKPNGYMNPFSFWEYVNTCLDGWGNAFLIIERNPAGVPIALHPVHPAAVTVTLYKLKKYYRIHSSSFIGIYPDEDMCHFMLMSLNGITGVNPILYNADAIGMGIAATKFGKEFFEKGGNIRSVLETDGNMSDQEYTNFIKHYRDSAKNFETPLLEYGVKYKSVGISPEAAQMLNTKIFAINDIARIFCIPPHLLAELSKSSFNNIEEQNMQFVQYTLRASVKRFEVELETKLFFSRERSGYEVKFDLNGLMRGNLKNRADFYHAGVLDGWLSRNEVRRLEGFKATDGLDDMLYPMNMTIVGKENTETTGKK